MPRFNFKLVLTFLLLISINISAQSRKKIAIMQIEDKTKSFSKSLLVSAEEYIRGELIASNEYLVISAERQQKVIMKDLKKQSYKKCYAKSCQIPLGKVLSADTILIGVITKFGKEYTLRLEMVDLAKEATILGATSDFSNKNDFKKAVTEALYQLLHPENDYMKNKLEKAEKEKNREKALNIYNQANSMAKRDTSRAIELYNDVIHLLNDEDDPYHRRSVKRRDNLQEKLDHKKKKEKLQKEKELISIMKENENYYEGDKFNPDKFKEEISNSDWVYFYKDKHGKYYYNKRTIVVEEGYGVKTVWYRCVVRKKVSFQTKISIDCKERAKYSSWDNGVYSGKRSIKPESILDYLQARICK